MRTSCKTTAHPSEVSDNADMFIDIWSGRVLPLSWTEGAWEPEVGTKLQANSNQPGRLVAVNGGNHAMNHEKAFTHWRGTMKAMVIYDHVASAARAVALLRHCLSLARVDAKWDIKPWRVDILRLPSAADEALLESIDADLVVFAALRASRLPKRLKEWLDRWSVRRQSKEPALVITRGAPDGRHYGFGHELLSFAVQNGLDLIVEAHAPVGADPLASALVELKAKSDLLAAARQATSGSADMTNCSYRNWGINE